MIVKLFLLHESPVAIVAWVRLLLGVGVLVSAQLTACLEKNGEKNRRDYEIA